MERLSVLSSLRALAALMVCMYHAAFLFAENFPQWVEVLDFGQEGVYVFFVISGLVMPMALEKMQYKPRDFGIFLLKRCLRLQPPLVLSAAVLTLLSYHQLKATDVSPALLFLGSATLTSPLFDLPFVNDIYWTLFVEMQYYIYIALLFPVLISPNRALRWIFTGGILMISLSSIIIEGKWIKLALPFHLPVFLMGYFLFLYITKRVKQLEFALGIALCAVFCLVVTDYVHGLGYRITSVALATTLVIAIFRDGPAWLNRIGEYSYSLYLFHWVFISCLSHYARPYLPGPWGSIMVYITIMVLSILGSKFFFSIIELPSLAWARKSENRFRKNSSEGR